MGVSGGGLGSLVLETNTGVYVSSTDTGTDPNIPDSDGDGLSDGAEINTYGSNPNLVDTDGDGVSDGNEVSNGTNPNVDETVDPQFQVIRGSYTWTEATSDAAARGGRLAVLNTQEKIDIATAIARSDTSPSLHGRNLLIGLKRSYSDNNFYWNKKNLSNV